MKMTRVFIKWPEVASVGELRLEDLRPHNLLIVVLMTKLYCVRLVGWYRASIHHVFTTEQTTTGLNGSKDRREKDK